MNLLNKPKRLENGDVIGVITPSFCGNSFLKDKFELGVSFLKQQGFKILLGELTASMQSQGYRAGSILERAEEFNQIYKNPKVKAIITTIGGTCSSSILPFIDYEYIMRYPKIFCGYSDITSIHAALNSRGNLTTFYGPAIIPSFGESPYPIQETLVSWEIQMGIRDFKEVKYVPPKLYSNHFINARNNNWKTVKREFKKNEGWSIVNKGSIIAPLFAYNLSTLLGLAGTDYFPSLRGKILLIEQMNVNFDTEERLLNQLKLMNVFNEIKGLIISKPENFNNCNAPFIYNDLLKEIIGKRPNYPIITNFDCGHTHPMFTMPEGVDFEFAVGDENIILRQLERGVF